MTYPQENQRFNALTDTARRLFDSRFIKQDLVVVEQIIEDVEDSEDIPQRSKDVVECVARLSDTRSSDNDRVKLSQRRIGFFVDASREVDRNRPTHRCTVRIETNQNHVFPSSATAFKPTCG
jgi:hypothetical protein